MHNHSVTVKLIFLISIEGRNYVNIQDYNQWVHEENGDAQVVDKHN